MRTDRKPAEGLPVGPPLTEEELRGAAVRRLRLRREFDAHLAAYLIVNGFLVAVWLVVALTVGFWFPWPLFPMAAWGIGLAFHAWAVFGPPSRPITDEQVDREMQRLRKQ